MRSLVRPVSKGWHRAYGIFGLWVGLNMTTDWALGVKFPFAESTIPQRIDLLRWKTPITSMRIRKSARSARGRRAQSTGTMASIRPGDSRLRLRKNRNQEAITRLETP